ncbi:molybdopterin-binding protein [Nesterenkonia sp.]|uniref:molybdopterin molybdotransferase MoeA n=1 Tax=Nesterenkonia sp. TaxID=704201 RepID=UPI002625A4FB|nr:molybdopterin-binding protein [Nesterenkonia sp.]
MRTLPEARRILAELPPLPAAVCRLDQAVSAVLAEPVRAQLPLPHADTSAMDGWAVSAGQQRWHVRGPGAEHPGTQLPPLRPGEAIGVVTGSPVPEGTVSVLRSEHGVLADDRLTPVPGTPDLQPGRNIRPAGIEASRGDELLSAGQVLTPVRAAVAAVAGYDAVSVHPTPRTEIITTGSEVISEGLPAGGQVRDTFTVSLPAMVAGLGGRAARVDRLEDDVAALVQRLTDSDAELIITTGGTAHSRADTLRPALAEAGAEVLVDSVDIRPGHPALAARLPSAAMVLGLPGNPLAGFAALTLLGAPLLGALRGAPDPLGVGVFEAAAAEALEPARRGHRLVPVLRRDGALHSTGYSRPHMMRGLARAEAFAVVPPAGIRAGETAECHAVPGHQVPGRSVWDD